MSVPNPSERRGTTDAPGRKHHTLAPAQLSPQCLRPRHHEIHHAHRQRTLEAHLRPIPPPCAPLDSRSIRALALESDIARAPEVARDPDLDGPADAGRAPDNSPADDGTTIMVE
jgi:hypothetical protein